MIEKDAIGRVEGQTKGKVHSQVQVHKLVILLYALLQMLEPQTFVHYQLRAGRLAVAHGNKDRENDQKDRS